MSGTKNSDQPTIHRMSRSRAVIFITLATVVVLIALELVLRLAGGGKGFDMQSNDMDRDMGDFVRFLEWDINIEQSGSGGLYVEDPRLMWRLRSGFVGWARDYFVMTVTDHAPRWHINISERGFRGPKFDDRPLPGTYRILCLGDSCTFGFGVGDNDTFPAMLSAALKMKCPTCRFEVINLGVPGYTSRQGLEMAKRWIARLEPKMVIVGYGTNDWWYREITDEEAIKQASATTAVLGRFMRRSAIVKTMSNAMAKDADPERGDTISTHRVSQAQYRENVEAISQIATEHGAKAMLLDMNFYVPYGTDALNRISKSKPEYLFLDAVGVLTESLLDIESLRKNWPVDIAVAEKIYSRVLKQRPIFYVMVDPVHPSALGHRLIAQRCASLLTTPSMNLKLVKLMTDTIESLPPARAVGADMLPRTALEKRLDVLLQQKSRSNESLSP